VGKKLEIPGIVSAIDIPNFLQVFRCVATYIRLFAYFPDNWIPTTRAVSEVQIRHNWAVNPSFNLVIKQRLSSKCKMSSLGIVDQLLELKVRNKSGRIILIGTPQKPFRNCSCISGSHLLTPSNFGRSQQQPQLERSSKFTCTVLAMGHPRKVRHRVSSHT
jgi:hypothetical protein